MCSSGIRRSWDIICRFYGLRGRSICLFSSPVCCSFAASLVLGTHLTHTSSSTVVIHYLKPKPTSAPGTPSNAHDIAAEITFDRRLAQISVGVDGLADSLVALTASRSQGIFIALSCLSSFTSGGNPALHSLGAICLHACGFSEEVGALFGAMGVLSAVAHIISVCTGFL